VSGRKRRYRRKDPFEGAEVLGGEKTKKQRGATNKAAASKKARTDAATAARLQRAQAKATKRVTAARAAHAARTAKTAEKAVEARAAAARVEAKVPPVPPPPPPRGQPGGAPTPHGAGPGRTGSGPGGSTAGGGGDHTAGVFLTPDPLWALERAAAVTRMHQVWMRRALPVLPPATVFSVVRLSGPPLAAAVRASTEVRVVLPRALLKGAFGALAAAARSGHGGVPDEHQLAVRIGDHNPVFAFESTLHEMSSLLAFNEGIVSSVKFTRWMRGLEASDAHLPAPLNFFSGELMSISSMVHQVRDNIAGRLLGDCVWSQPPVSRGAAAAEKADSAFSGYMVNVQDVCDAGQPEYITNALLDAGMAGLQGRCNAGSVPIGVLSSSQSASFTHVGKKEVSLERAVPCVLEVLISWSASVTQFVMVLNVRNEHWMSAAVSLSNGRVILYDSLCGSSQAKRHIVSRLQLFARCAERRWRATHPNAAQGAIEWQFNEDNTPQQMDHYNCGLFAFAFIWCFAYGLDMTTSPVNGDQLRLSLILYVLMSGAPREKTQ